MKHRKLKHIDTVAPCRNEIAGACTFTDEMCWWTHGKRQTGANENVKCFICDEIFENKVSMMMHRKLIHTTLVRMCDKFTQNICRFREKLLQKLKQSKEEGKEKCQTIYQNLSDFWG